MIPASAVEDLNASAPIDSTVVAIDAVTTSLSSKASAAIPTTPRGTSTRPVQPSLPVTINRSTVNVPEPRIEPSFKQL